MVALSILRKTASHLFRLADVSGVPPASKLTAWISVMRPSEQPLRTFRSGQSRNPRCSNLHLTSRPNLPLPVRLTSLLSLGQTDITARLSTISATKVLMPICQEGHTILFSVINLVAVLADRYSRIGCFSLLMQSAISRIYWIRLCRAVHLPD